MALAIYVTRRNRESLGQRFGVGELIGSATGKFLVEEKYKAPVVLDWDEFHAKYPESNGVPADEFEWYDVTESTKE